MNVSKCQMFFGIMTSSTRTKSHYGNGVMVMMAEHGLGRLMKPSIRQSTERKRSGRTSNEIDEFNLKREQHRGGGPIGSRSR